MTGQAAIVVDNKQAFADAEKVVTAVTLGLIVILLLVIFRSPLAALLPLLTVGVVFGISTSLVAAAGRAFHFQVGQELPTMLTVVLFGIGTDYILFLLFRYRERLRTGDTPGEAIVAAVERVGEAIFSAAFAVIAAIGRFVARRPVVVIVASVVLLGGLGAGALRYHADYDPIGQLPTSTEATRAYTDLKEGFPAGALNPTDVYLRSDAPLDRAALGAFVQKIAAVPGVAGPMQPKVSADGRTVDVPLVLKLEPYGGAALDLVSGPLRDAARAAAPAGSQVLIGGQTMAFADVRDTTSHDLGLIFPVAGLLFLLILAALLRAVLALVYLVGLVVGGFAATLGAATALIGHAAWWPGHRDRVGDGAVVSEEGAPLPA